MCTKLSPLWYNLIEKYMKIQEEMKQKVPVRLNYNASLGINFEEKECLLIGI